MVRDRLDRSAQDLNAINLTEAHRPSINPVYNQWSGRLHWCPLAFLWI